jgi:hypothetical protein
MNRRMLPPTQIAYQVRTVNGRTYRGSPGVTIDIPDFDADVLAANGWTDLGPSGTTAQRPTGTLGRYITPVQAQNTSIRRWARALRATALTGAMQRVPSSELRLRAAFRRAFGEGRVAFVMVGARPTSFFRKIKHASKTTVYLHDLPAR